MNRRYAYLQLCEDFPLMKELPNAEKDGIMVAADASSFDSKSQF